MARSRKPAPTSAPDHPLAPPVNVPEWFQTPTDSAIRRPEHSLFGGESRHRLARVVETLLAGEFALPPWQRGAVWSDAQRIKLFDSIVRGISIGVITTWHPHHREEIERCQFGGPTIKHPRLVVDGQQRLTTLLMAARGDLDHWRWNGREWSEGPGFLTPSIAIAYRNQREWSAWLRERADETVARRCLTDAQAIEDHEITLMTLDGSTTDMVETYRRLATCGSPHSIDDLSVMERWLEAQGPK
jgi:hypothetical protein